jgi:hypothetical protein
MSNPSNEPTKPWQQLGSDSHGAVDIVFDGPGDNTIRPCPPELLAHARAMREKEIRYGTLKESKSDSAPPSANPTDAP